jgi:hypothetical protein
METRENVVREAPRQHLKFTLFQKLHDCKRHRGEQNRDYDGREDRASRDGNLQGIAPAISNLRLPGPKLTVVCGAIGANYR